MVLLAVFLFCRVAPAQTVRTIGPVDVSFYNSTQKDEANQPSIQDWTSEQMDAVAAAVAAWSSRIVNLPARQINLHLFWHYYGDGTLGATTTPHGGDGTTSWTFAEHPWRDFNAAASPNSYDVWMDFDTSTSWSFGAGSPGGYMDFRSVMPHELGHALGFVSTYNSNSQTFSSLGLSAWDKWLWDGLHSPSTTAPPGTFNATANPVWFSGTHAKAANGTNNVAVYAPNPYEPGSSMSHLNDATFPAALMKHALGYGTTIRAPTTLEWAVMQDLGWSVATAQSWTKGGGNLNWTTASNWNPGDAAPTQNSTVTLTNTGLNTGDVLNLGGNQSVNALTIDATNGFTVGSGANTLTLRSGDLTRSAASSGTQTIASSLSLTRNGIWDIDGTGQLTLSGGAGGLCSLYKLGAGLVAVGGTSNLTGDVVVSEGDLSLIGSTLTARSVTGNGSLNFDGGNLTQTGTNTLYLRGIRVGKATAGSFILGPGKTLTTDVFLTVGRDSGGQGTFTNQSGTVTAKTNLFVGVFAGSSGTYIQQTDPAPGSAAPATNVTGYTSIGDQGGTGLMQLKSGTYNTQDLEIGALNSTSGPGTLTQTGGTMTVSRHLQIAGSASGTYNLNGGTLITGELSQGTLGSVAPVFTFGGGTLKASSTLNTSIPLTLNAGGGTIDNNGFAVTCYGAVAGVGGLTATGSGTVTLSVANYYLGATTISGGSLQFAKRASLYNDTPASWTAANIAVKSGATAAFNVGGTGEFRSGDIDTLKALGTTSGGFTSGSAIGFDTTNSGGTFSYDTAIGDTNSNNNRLGLVKLGAGALILGRANTYTGGTDIKAGTLELAPTSDPAPYAGNISGAGNLTKSGAAKVVLNGTNTYTGKTTVTAGTLQLSASAQAPIFNTTPGAGADIQGGKMLLDGMPSTVPGLLASSYAGGAWNTGQFQCTTQDGSRGLGWEVAGTQTKVAYTFYGDATLDGSVDATDLAKVLANYNQLSGMVWSQGDFDYNATVDGSDLAKVLANYNQGPIVPGITAVGLDAQAIQMLTAAGFTVVPEPGTLVLLAAGFAALAGWMIRRRK